MAVQVSRLDNGLTIATHEMSQIESVALGIWVKAGARNEKKNQHGMAHLLEHMAFKGTQNRTALQIATDIEDVGGEINAATSTETTGYFARVLKEDISLAIDILTDIITNPLFDEQELELEKHVILQEIGAAHDTPDDVIFDHFNETAYRHQTIGRPILGTAETVQSFSPADLRAFMNEHYSTAHMIVTAAGAVEHESFVRQIDERMQSYPLRPMNVTPDLANYVGGDYREYRDLRDAQLLIGFEGRAYHMRDFYASQLLSMILGGGMSSRLFQEVRENRGLCYSIYAFHWGFSDTGLFGVHAASGEDDMAKLVPVILDELEKVGEKIDEREVNRARAQYRAGLMMAGESPSARAHHMARQLLLYGRLIPNSELMERLSQISAERVRDLARRLFVESKPTMAALGPVGQLMPFDDLQMRLRARL